MPSITANYNSSGPIVEVRIGVSAPRRKALTAQGLEVPPTVKIPMIIDTGAETSLISEQHMRTLGIAPKGMREILTATSDAGSTECHTYDVEICLDTKVVGDAPFVVQATEIIGRPFFNHAVEGMIGRDVLSRLVLTLDGPKRRFKLDW